MGGLAPAASQDARGRNHALQVIRIGLAPDEDDLAAARGPFHSRARVEDRLTDRCSG